MTVIEPTILSQDSADQGVLPGQTKKILQDIAFGSIAGIAGKFIEYPFDTVKVRLQSQANDRPLQYKGPLDCFRKSYLQQGVLGLYRGISAPLLGAAIETSSLFLSYRLAQNILQATVYQSIPTLPINALVLCGAASGAVTSLALTPIELIKCKMQVPAHGSFLAPGAFSLIASIFRTQGLLGFWHGQLGTLIRETGGSAAWFGSFEAVCLGFRHFRGPEDDPSKPLRIDQQLVAGALAGMAYNFVFYPADTVKSRMQTEDIAVGTRQRKNTFWTVGKALWQDQGLKGLYRGCGITVGRAAPSSAFIFMIYERLKNTFE